MIDVHRLQILREVAERGSFAAAAAALRLTPSAVSQQVAALERSLGRPVVERSTRGVRLTESGQVLVEAAATVAAELSAAQQRIDRLAAGQAGRLTVATFTSGGQRLLPATLARFTASHPGVELTVMEAEPEDSHAMVRDGRADLALSYNFGAVDPAPGLTWIPLMDDPMRIVVPSGHHLAGRGSVALTELCGERWLQGCMNTGEVLDTYAALAGFDPQVVCRTTDYLFTQSLVAAEFGIAMIPSVALAIAPPHDVAVIPLEQPCPIRYIGAVTARRRWPQPLVIALLEALHHAVSAAC